MIRLLFLFLTLSSFAFSQFTLQDDPCGFPADPLAALSGASGNWGYGYDTLLYDLSEWKKSPFAVIDSVGASVQGRTLFVVTVQDTSADTLSARQRVWIHARTHPGEVQSTWVTNEIVKQLLAESDTAAMLRRRYVFNIMPMYNPDGVELGLARQNANGVDIESNWNSASPQPEVLVLRSQFEQNMAKTNPMRVMLNMHSAYSCKRYFVYHAPGGTSMIFSQLEQRFINYVRMNFPGAIEPYTYFVSWVNAPATQYPESWCWSNYKENIMALTYEDGNCAAAEKFDSTARAILLGIDSYLQDTSAVTTVPEFAAVPRTHQLLQNFPNPFNPSTVIAFSLTKSGPVTLQVYDLLGRSVTTLAEGEHQAGEYSVRFSAEGLAGGVYLYRLTTSTGSETRKMHYLR